MLAVQALYLQAQNEIELAPEILIAQMLGMIEDEKAQKLGEIDLPAPPDKKLFRTIISGYYMQEDEIDQRIDEALEKNWRNERMSQLLRSILRAAAFEFIYTPALRTGIIINEYVDITASFFDDPELGLTNGLLQELANKLRG
jgi:N utilization substance protein B